MGVGKHLGGLCNGLALLTVDVASGHEIVGIHCIQLSIVAKRHQISACCTVIINVVERCCSRSSVHVCHWGKSVLILKDVFGWIHKGTWHKTFLPVSSNNPVPVGVFFVEN